MRLGLNLGYWDSGGSRGTRATGTAGNPVARSVALAREAERLGYAMVWAAEAYGSDAATPLTWLAAHTTRIDVGSAVFQIPARTPAMTAMTAATLDTLSAGRFRLGLGVSGPQVSEGWHGVRFDAPLARTREYVDIVRMALRRETVRYDGSHFPLPLPDGPGKPLRLMLPPARADLPVYLAAVGPKNLQLAGEIADGWLALFLAPEHAEDSFASLRAGRLAAGKDLAGFDVVATVPVATGADPDQCADRVRTNAALYLGGMGSREQNFYNRLAVRMGYADEAAQVQDHYLAGRHREAAAAVPGEFLARTCLLGSRESIAERLSAYAAVGVTTISVTPYADGIDEELATLRTVSDALDASGLAD